MKKNPPEKSCPKCDEKTSPKLFSKNSKLSSLFLQL